MNKRQRRSRLRARRHLGPDAKRMPAPKLQQLLGVLGGNCDWADAARRMMIAFQEMSFSAEAAAERFRQLSNNELRVVNVRVPRGDEGNSLTGVVIDDDHINYADAFDGAAENHPTTLQGGLDISELLDSIDEEIENHYRRYGSPGN